MSTPVFVNHTNHASADWSAAQRSAAAHYGNIVDVPFPHVSPLASHAEVMGIAQNQAEKIMALNPVAVLCQGEFTYTFNLIKLLLARSVPVVAATSERIAEETTDADGAKRKVSLFRFAQFRNY